MSICIECGKPACGEETFEGKKGKITCYYCHEHINQVNMDTSTVQKLRSYKPKE